MKQRILGRDLEVSAVGLGCRGFPHAYGYPADKRESLYAIQQAFENGYTFFDTAECYIGKNKNGVVEHNEDLVGEALKPYRDQVKIATKCGVRHRAGMLVMNSKPETIRKSIDTSLLRLKTDYVDLFYQHRIDPKVSPEEVAETMKELMKEGKILHWGISEANEKYIRRAHAVCPVTCIQNRYSMMARWYEDLFPVLEELNIGYVAFSPLANGVLSDCFTKESKFEKGDFRNIMPQYTKHGFKKNEELLYFLRELARDKNTTPAQISLAWMLNKKSYIVPIPGSRKAERIIENGAAADIELTADETEEIDNRLNAIKMSTVFGGSPIKK